MTSSLMIDSQATQQEQQEPLAGKQEQREPQPLAKREEPMESLAAKKEVSEALEVLVVDDFIIIVIIIIIGLDHSWTVNQSTNQSFLLNCL